MDASHLKSMPSGVVQLRQIAPVIVSGPPVVHDLFQPLQALQRGDVARRDAARDDFVAAHFSHMREAMNKAATDAAIGALRGRNEGLRVLESGAV